MSDASRSGSGSEPELVVDSAGWVEGSPDRVLPYSRIIKQSFSIYFRNLGPILAVMLLVALPKMAVTWFMPELLSFGQVGNGLVVMGQSIALIDPMGWIFSALSLLGCGAVMIGSRYVLVGEGFDWDDSLLECLGRFLPLLGSFLLMSIGIAVAGLFFVVPGVILAVMLWVTLPVALFEKPGVYASLKRSAELTAGHRGYIFGFTVYFGLVSLLLAFSVGWGALSLFDQGYDDVGLFLLFLLEALALSFTAVWTTVIYAHLRRLKEGKSVEELPQIFE